MIPRVVVGIAMVVSMVGAGGAIRVPAAETKQSPDLTGQWRLDPKRSDSMQRPEGASESPGTRGGGWGGGKGGPGGGGWGGARGGRGGDKGRGLSEPGARPVRLPELLHITQTATIVSFEDTSGTVLQEITTLGGAKDTLAHSPGAPVLSGQWNGDTLQVQRPGPGGGTVTETFTLEDQGNALVIETRIEASGDMPARDFRRVYSRTAG